MTLATHPASATEHSVPWPTRPTSIPPPHAAPLPERLIHLAALRRSILQKRFAAARAPHDLSLLDGEPACLGLLPGGQPVARWAASEHCPWIGKSFHLAAPDLLVGHNRLRLFGGARALAFEGVLGTSAVDGRWSLILRYDTPGNTQTHGGNDGSTTSSERSNPAYSPAPSYGSHAARHEPFAGSRLTPTAPDPRHHRAPMKA